ncbi:MAG: YodC family protein [Gammaproteobacteria bacterium]
MADNIKVGDVVQLKSGGPMMTVGEVRDDGIAVCEWFVKGGKTETRGFPLKVLDLAY